MIIQNYTTYEDNVFVLNTPLELDVPSLMYSSSKKIVFDSLMEKPDMYVVDLSEIQLTESMDTLKKITILNPRAKFIFIVEILELHMLKLLSVIFVWKVLFVHRVSGNISTYFPYKTGSLHDSNIETVNIGNCFDNCDYHFIDDFSVFFKHSPVKFCFLYEPGYQIGIDEEQKGINLDLFDLLSDRMGLKSEWHLADFPSTGDFSSFRVKHLGTNEICDCFVNLYAWADYDFVPPFLFDEVVFYVPVPFQIPRWQYLMKPITFDIWWYWILASVILTIVWSSACYIFEGRYGFMQVITIFIVNFEFFIERSHNLLKSKFSKEIVYCLMFFQAFLLNMIFKCNFQLVLSGLSYENPIESLEDMVENGLIFGVFGFPELLSIIRAMDVHYEDYIMSHYEICDNSLNCINRASVYRNIGVENSLRFFQYHQKYFLDETGKPLLVKLQNPLQHISTTVILPLGHPLTGVFSRNVANAVNHGFLEYILRKYDKERMFILPYSTQVSKLTFDHILAATILLICGLLVGFLSFIIELILGTNL